ncbi:MAG: GAF domain-containing protein [Bacteroidales bacterium]|jgi:GAF domain-containing protein|nr:GAF domain-containing protein [Bacteroidales bacterium]
MTPKKTGRYQRILAQLEELLLKTDFIYARMATVNALLYHKMDHFFWVGFYLMVNDELTVGPYQGALACQVLKKDSGVCWAAINEQQTIIVPDVHQFSGHIACDSRSKSEIVVPLRSSNNEIIGCLDVDSDKLAAFDETDALYLERIVSLITNTLTQKYLV